MGTLPWHQVASQALTSERARCSSFQSLAQVISPSVWSARLPPVGASEPAWALGRGGDIWRTEGAGGTTRGDSRAVCHGLRGEGGWTPAPSSQGTRSCSPQEEPLLQWEDDLAGCRVVVRLLSRILSLLPATKYAVLFAPILGPKGPECHCDLSLLAPLLPEGDFWELETSPT